MFCKVDFIVDLVSINGNTVVAIPRVALLRVGVLRIQVSCVYPVCVSCVLFSPSPLTGENHHSPISHQSNHQSEDTPLVSYPITVPFTWFKNPISCLL